VEQLSSLCDGGRRRRGDRIGVDRQKTGTYGTAAAVEAGRDASHIRRVRRQERRFRAHPFAKKRREGWGTQGVKTVTKFRSNPARWNKQIDNRSIQPRSGGMKVAGAVRPRVGVGHKMRAAERRHRVS